MIDKYRLPNDNIFMWLGTTEEAVNNVLILAGGDILFLTAHKTLPLSKKNIIDDLRTLDCISFNEKYETPINDELWEHLRIMVETGEYLSFRKVNARQEYQSMIRQYINASLQITDPKKKIEILDEIIDDCIRRRREIERGTVLHRMNI